MDELTGRLKKRLETPAMARAADGKRPHWRERKLQEVTTASVEAFKHYAEGSRLHDRLQEKEAQAYFVHPGVVLLEDFIEPLGITRYRLAKAIGVQQRRIDEICAGKRGISAETAVRLGLAFNVDPQFWLNLQAQYDIEVIQREQGAQLSEEVHELAA